MRPLRNVSLYEWGLKSLEGFVFLLVIGLPAFVLAEQDGLSGRIAEIAHAVDSALIDMTSIEINKKLKAGQSKYEKSGHNEDPADATLIQ